MTFNPRDPVPGDEQDPKMLLRRLFCSMPIEHRVAWTCKRCGQRIAPDGVCGHCGVSKRPPAQPGPVEGE
jgi:hypothetical protein